MYNVYVAMDADGDSFWIVLESVVNPAQNYAATGCSRFLGIL